MSVLILDSELTVLNFQSLTYFPIMYYTTINKGLQWKVFLSGFFTGPRNSPRKIRVMYYFELIFSY